MNKPHVILQNDYIKVRDLKVGEIFYHDFDNFVFFNTTNKRYVEKFEEDGAIVQVLHRNDDKSWGFNVKGKYDLDQMVFVLRGEFCSVWDDKKYE